MPTYKVVIPCKYEIIGSPSDDIHIYENIDSMAVKSGHLFLYDNDRHVLAIFSPGNWKSCTKMMEATPE